MCLVPASCKAMLEDRCILTGAKVITEESGIKLEGVQIADLREAERVTTRTTR